MPNNVSTPGIAAHRLPTEALDRNFSDLHPPLSRHEAAVAADRCYFCYDAPCIEACPTGIDIPLFIRQISSGIPEAAAKTIFDSNILGGMCARVCPTETLCEEACVREAAEGNPVEIGRLQRFATDTSMASGIHPYMRAEPTGKHVAVAGAGPAGLACAHRLALKGHQVTIFEARQKPGGLNEFGIAAYKTVNQFAAREVDWLLGIGGIAIEFGREIDSRTALDEIRKQFDAVFLAIGLAGVNALGIEGDANENVSDAVEFIATLRQAEDLGEIPVGNNVVVIGGGMTAIDAAAQSRLLGAENVSLVYRRSREDMGASQFEQELAATKGVKIIVDAMPCRIEGGGKVEAIDFERTTTSADGLEATGQTFRLRADQVFRAIGQSIRGVPEGLEIKNGKIAVSGAGQTSIAGVWAGGDCVEPGDDLTVTAVAQGRDAAEDIHASLVAG